MAKNKLATGMGADAFFGSAQPAVPMAASMPAKSAVQPAVEEERAERRSFNLKPSTLRLLDEIQIKTIREGDKWTLSAIVERGIELVAKEKRVQD